MNTYKPMHHNDCRLCGTAAHDPVPSHSNHGVLFFRFPLSVPRLSGQCDTVNIIVPETLLEACPVTRGQQLCLTGQLRSYNNKTGAQWIWERPNVRKLLQNGEDVFIRLNKAGGYRRVKVLITNLFVQGLEVMPYTNEQQVKPVEEKEPSVVADEPLKVNYELMAFDWVENHIAELNERCNNAIGDGKDSILLTAEELPVQESWASICEELKRMDLSAVEMVPEGIKITLLQ